MAMQWDREAEPEHQRLLELIAPRGKRLSWLYLAWEPGDTWEPIHRWIIYQMRPTEATNPEILNALRGPHPRSAGFYNEKTGIWEGSANPLVDRQQWEIYQKTGNYGKRWWVIQGRHGGHRFMLDKIESKISKLNGGPKDTPAAGALPYAEFDMRTFWKVAALDSVRAYKGVVDYCNRNHDTLDEDERTAKIEAQAQVWKWLESQTEQTYDSISKKEWNEFRAAIPVAPGTKDNTDFERVQQDWITTPNS